MTTQQIADRLVELCRKGDYKSCYDELYSPDIISVGPAGSHEEKPVQGFNEIAEKAKSWHNNMDTFIKGRVSDPLVAGNYITLTMGFECVWKGDTESSKEEEVCVYEVKEGKIVKEIFFYEVKAME